MTRATHQLAVLALEKEGYSRSGWRKALRAAVEFAGEPEDLEDLEVEPGFRRLPDAFLLAFDVGPRNYPRLEAVEVVVTNGISDAKLENYVSLWWLLDSIGLGVDFDLFVMHPGGERRLVIGSSDFGTLLDYERAVGARNTRGKLVPAVKEVS